MRRNVTYSGCPRSVSMRCSLRFQKTFSGLRSIASAESEDGHWDLRSPPPNHPPTNTHQPPMCVSVNQSMVPRGLEPRTLQLLAVRSNQLSYETSGGLPLLGLRGSFVRALVDECACRQIACIARPSGDGRLGVGPSLAATAAVVVLSCRPLCRLGLVRE